MGLIQMLACRELRTVPKTATVSQAIDEMRKYAVSSVLVAEGGNLFGVLTERDIVRIAAEKIDMDKTSVSKVMTKNLVSVQDDRLLDEALTIMEQKKIRHLLVTDEKDVPLGIISYTDIVRKLEEDFFKAPRPVSDYMTRNLQTLPANSILEHAINFMHQRNISSIIIVDDGVPVGILTERDIVRLIKDRVSRSETVDNYMSKPVLQVAPDTSLYEVSRMMEKTGIRHMVVWDGKIAQGIVTNTDIVKSIRDNYRSFLEKEAVRTRKILDMIHEGVVELDGNNYEIVWLNKRGANILGFASTSEAKGNSLLEMIFEEDRFILQGDFKRERPRSNFQCRVKLDGERNITALMTYDLIKEDALTPIWRILIRDISHIVENRRRMEEVLRHQKRQFQALFENTTDAVVIFDKEKNVQMANSQFLKLFGYERREVVGRTITELVDPYRKAGDHISEETFKGRTATWETIRYNKLGNPIEVLLKGGPVIVDGEVAGGYSVYSDISDRKRIMQELRDSEEQFRSLIESMGEGMALQELVCDEQGNATDYRYLEINPAFEEITGLKRAQVIGKLATEIFETPHAANLERYEEVVRTGKPIKFQTFNHALDKYFRVSAFSPKRNQFAVVFEDFTEQKQKEDQIQYLIYHDTLTGVYNRSWFEKKMQEIDGLQIVPTALIMADLNGLKLINDAFGHEKGDELIKKAANLIVETTGRIGDVARVGGDEFVVIMEGIQEDECREILHKLKKESEQLVVEGVQLSIAFGMGVKSSDKMKIMTVYKHSEVEMYNKKLMESQEAKNQLVNSLLQLMEKRAGESKQHCQNVMELSEELGEALGLAEEDVDKLRVLALLHDIGTITIPEEILKKPAALDKDEWILVRKHPETGYRIVSAIPEFANVAEFILCHHERYDGRGYPRNLIGSEIPVISRVLTIVDAWEVMLRDKPYKKAKTKAEAIEELKANAGTQFDPEIVEVFIEKVVPQL